MRAKHILSKDVIKKGICIILLLIVAVLSMTVVSKVATSPENYRSTIQSIDEKKQAVLAVSATSAIVATISSTALGEGAQPVANQIMELSTYLMIVVCVLVLEKSILTVMGYLSFNFLVPIACVMLGISMFISKDTLRMMAFKLIVFALVIVMIIPVGIKIGDMIFEANQATYEELMEETKSIAPDEKSLEEEIQQQNWYNRWLKKAEKVVTELKNTVQEIKEWAETLYSKIVDTVALFLIAYCALPVMVALFFIWFINFLFKINIPTPNISVIKQVTKKALKTKETTSADEELVEV